MGGKEALARVIVGESPAMIEVRRLIRQVAATDIAVFIAGDTGTGKELVAQSIHRESRRTGTCVAVNVCAIAESMFEATLFGHVRGAFTGAMSDSDGLLLEANRGTLFLDEISGLPLAEQSKLLRAVETGTFRPVGDRQDRQSMFRLISASNERLEDAVSDSRFRRDLLHRLSGIVISLPPLRERKHDIPLLVRHYAARLSTEDRPLTVTQPAISVLQDQEWPGNVRELLQVLTRCIVLGDSSVIDDGDVALALTHGQRHVCSGHVSERQRLVRVMEEHGWDTVSAAGHLGIHRGTLYRRLRRWGIALPQQRRDLISANTPD